jgi:hypothetical protein
LVHDNITLHGSVEDVVLHPRPDRTIPDVEAMTIAPPIRGASATAGCRSRAD